MTQNALKTFRFVRLALMASVGFPLILASNAFAQLPAPAVPAEPAAAPPSSAEVERVVVTGSNIPTAEETGPNPVDTYRPQDIEKLGIRSATDLQQFIPQQAGGTVNLNIGNAGDGTIQFNLRGMLPKETLILIDGKRVASGSLAAAGASGGPDINLIPFSMVDHVDILKDGASAVYGSDAIAGVVNFFLVHKFRGLEIGGTTEIQTWERPMKWASGRHGSKPAPETTRLTSWSLPTSSSASMAFIAVTAIFPPMGISTSLADLMRAAGTFLAALGSSRLIPSIFFSSYHSDATLGAEQIAFSVLYQSCSISYSRPH